MAHDYKIFIDTNVLVYATLLDFEPAKNKEALNTLNSLRKQKSELFISTQILREFYANDFNYIKEIKLLNTKPL